MHRNVMVWLAAAVGLLVPAIAGAAPAAINEKSPYRDWHTAPAMQQIPSDLVAFGRMLAGFASANDSSAIASLLMEREFVCGPDVYRFAVCEEEPDGTIVAGYDVGRWNSEGNVVSREAFEAWVLEAAGRFSSRDIRLYTASPSGFGDCPECAVMVLSTPEDVQGAGLTKSILVFQVRRTGGDYRIFSAIDGFLSHDEIAVVNGGAFGRQLFERIEPGAPAPPSSGSGMHAGAEDATARATGLALLAGTILIIAGLSVMAVCISGGATGRNRQNAAD